MIPAFPVSRFLYNSRVDRKNDYPQPLRSIINPDGIAQASAAISSWPGYAPTPLRSFNGFAARVGVEEVRYKDESSRFGLGSFKALGGAYAVQRLLVRECAQRRGEVQHTGSPLVPSPDLCAGITVTCATDGNHGRAVAWAAQEFGCQCVVFLHENVSIAREKAIARYGARTIRVPGTYDDSVRAAAKAAAQHGWFVVSDTSYPGYTEIPAHVMHGYTLIANEIFRQLPDPQRTTHLIVQAGVGGLAAALVAQFWIRMGSQRPICIVIEPDTADCLYQSALAGTPVAIEGDCSTVMAGLSCGEPSVAAWEILGAGVDYFATIPDTGVAGMMRHLASGAEGVPVVAGESAVAGLLFLHAAEHSGLLHRFNLSSSSRVLLIGTEGDTDPEIYRQMVSHTGE